MSYPHSLRSLIAADLDRFTETFRLRGVPHSAFKVAFESFMFKAGFQAVFLYRLSFWFYQKKWLYLAWALARFNQWLTGAEIEFNAEIGPGLFIAHPGGIVVGRGTKLGAHCTLFQGVSFGVRDWSPENIRKFPKAGNNCIFYAGVGVFGDVQIGDNCILGAHTLVLNDVPSGSLAIGNPARIVADKGESKLREWGLCVEL